MSEYASFLCFLHLLFLHPSVLPKTQQSNPPINFQLPGWITICWLHYLLRHRQFCFALYRLLHFCQFTCFIYIFEFECVWTCFFSMYHPFCLFFIANCSQRLNRAIHQYIFSNLASARFADCNTCLANTNFVLVCTDNRIFTSFLIIYFLVWICLNIFYSHVHLFAIFLSQCAPHSLSGATMDCHLKRSPLLSWCAKSNLSSHSFVGTHSCFIHSSPKNLLYPVQSPPTSHINWKDNTFSHPNSGIKTL